MDNSEETDEFLSRTDIEALMMFKDVLATSEEVTHSSIEELVRILGN